jgi:hypothetical protein
MLRRAGGAVITLLLLAGLSQTAAAQIEPFIELRVTDAGPGDTFEVIGQNHTACVDEDSEVAIFFDDTLIGLARVEENGNFQTQVTLPTRIEDPPPGEQHVVSTACEREAEERLAGRTLPAQSGSVEFEGSITTFGDEGENRGARGQRVNAVGAVSPPFCDPVFIFFDDQLVAEAAGHPDPPGFSGGIFEVPEDAEPGPNHLVSASCEESGDPVTAEGAFTVLGAGPAVPAEAVGNRSQFVASVRDATEVFGDAGQILRNVLLALLLALLIVFPSQLFNSTLEEHYDEIRGWFRFGRTPKEPGGPPSRSRGRLAFLIFAVLGAVAYGFLDPGFGLNAASAILFTGMLAAIILGTLAFEVTSGLYLSRKHAAEGTLRVLPGTLVVAIVCVLISRLTGFLPGYFYGFIAGFAFQRAFSRHEEGRGTAVSALITLGVTMAAWLVWIPIKEAAVEPGAAAPILVVEAVLVATFVAGLEGLVFGMVPMRYLDGQKLFAWNKPLWAVIFSIGAFGFIHIIVNANSAGPEPSSVWTTMALFLGFGLFSVLFWGYFRLRRTAPAPASPGTSAAPPPAEPAPVPARPGPAPEASMADRVEAPVEEAGEEPEPAPTEVPGMAAKRAPRKPRPGTRKPKTSARKPKPKR